jgi:Ni,Fe-hydrogenase I large subunit
MSRATPHEPPPDVRVERTFAVDPLSRVEGEGRLRVVVRGDEVITAELSIFEAPRFFERLVVGRHPDEVLDIVARICGICPVAYQMTAVEAFERLFQVELDPQVRQLRRLFYWGEWLQSHALHIYLLNAAGAPSILWACGSAASTGCRAAPGRGPCCPSSTRRSPTRRRP